MLVIIDFFKLLISGVLSVFGFFTQIPTIMSACFLVLPPALGTMLLTAFCILIAVRVLELLP